jgi:hypothetical protein
MLSRYTDRRGLRIWLVGVALAFIVLGATGSQLLAVLPFAASVVAAAVDQRLRKRRETRRATADDSLDSQP